MKIAHEVPISLLEKSLEFNDYDYALVHLFEQYPAYFDFYKKSIESGRSVILDNSAFELGAAFETNAFADWIRKLQPTEYIIPDVIGDGPKTAANVESWINQYGDLPGIKIGVVQGRTLNEFVECYNRIFPLVDKIALCYNYEFLVNPLSYNNMPVSYNDNGDAITTKTIFSSYDQFRLAEFSMNRPLLIEYIRDNLPTKPTHLLGCSVPQEFIYYRDQEIVYQRPPFDFLQSCDTSNPIVHAINGIRYEDYGLDNKIPGLLVEYIEETDFDMELMEYNIKVFRSFVK